MNIDDIYTELILENSRSTRHRRLLTHPTHTLRGVNPSCGDDITLELEVKDGMIKDAGFSGEGCAISQASTTMMIDLVIGKTVEEAKQQLQRFFLMVLEGETDEKILAPLQDASVFQRMAKIPARVKCALLPWRTLEKELE